MNNSHGDLLGNETSLEEYLIVAEGGLSFFLCGDASPDCEVAASSLMDLVLAFLFLGSSIKDSFRLAGRSSRFELCSFYLSTSSARGRPLASF
ncbi:unnamed protein product [Prunus armeniaca]